ncbi:MAG: EAL domain-containing protein [Gammaproteobacteria bacterium]|nr:EAL domain-containing protein [Gammaproteobacteria bacterium]
MSAILVIVAVAGNTYIQQGHAQFLANSKERTKVIEVLQQVDLNFRNSASALEDLLLLPGEKAYLETFFSSQSRANVTLSALIDLNWHTSNEIKMDLARVLNLSNTVEDKISRVFNRGPVENTDALSKLTTPTMLQVLSELSAIENHVRELSKQDLESLTNAKNSLVDSIMVVTFFGLLIIVGVFVTTHSIVIKPLKKLTTALDMEARGEQADLQLMPRHIEMRQLIQAFINMSDQVKLRQVQLEHQALHDGLTGLPNRTLMLDRINQIIKSSQRNHIKPAVILLDLDRFKEINDTLGHHVGDTLLQEISRRLMKVLRNLDTIARLGGDEFAILLHDVDVQGASVVASKITNALAQPFEIEKHQLLIRCSQGIAFYPEHGETEADLLKHADIAMYIAKRNHLGHCIYDPKDDHHDVSHISLSADLTTAIEENKLELFYQPKVDSRTGEVIASEALIRWNHPLKGFISPELIIEVAEQSGLIQNLTEWVIRTAIKQARKWQDMGMYLGVGVNLSVFNLRCPNLVSTTRQYLESAQLSAERLILEVTESSMMLNPELAAKVLTNLSNMGVKISIDDFGTGYSSLAYLKNLPVHELKIDRSFVMNIATDKSDISIVKSTIELAHNLGLSVVAEGVENQESWYILDNLGCDIIQGYYISKPIPAEAFNTWYMSYTNALSDVQQSSGM